jgi:hypothetical protein
LVCKGYSQVEGINFEETFTLVARMEAIKMILAYACSKNIEVYQMDVKSTFLNGDLKEDVYIEQLKGFQLKQNEGYVCKLKKSLQVAKFQATPKESHVLELKRIFRYLKGT